MNNPNLARTLFHDEQSVSRLFSMRWDFAELPLALGPGGFAYRSGRFSRVAGGLAGVPYRNRRLSGKSFAGLFRGNAAFIRKTRGLNELKRGLIQKDDELIQLDRHFSELDRGLFESRRGPVEIDGGEIRSRRG
jgi:hypothetical protein